MKRDEAMQRLKDLLPVVQAQYDVAALSLFGSVMRDEATGASLAEPRRTA